MSAHTCRPSANPRKREWCDCGQRYASSHNALERNREFEQSITREMCAGLHIDPQPLISFAERRADRAQAEYGHDFPSLERNLIHETADELADARNYIVWLLDAIHRDLVEGGDRVMHLQRALRHVALAFEEIRAAQ